MITAKTIRRLSGYGPMSLTRVLHDSGYTKDYAITAEFVGITTGGDFCYKISYKDDGEILEGKVFLREDRDSIIAEY